MTATKTKKFPLPALADLEPETRIALEHLLPSPQDASAEAYAAALEQLAVDVTKALIVDAVQKANSGHPGGPLSSIDFMHVLWTEHLALSPDPAWLDRDRFVLSGGHMSMLLYAYLFYAGRITLDDLMRFRQLGAPTQGHPVYRLCPGVETSTGPLGQGFANAVGMAVAEKLLRSAFGEELVNHRTWVVATDGDIQEGVCREAAAVASLLGLEKLIVFYDSNHIQLASSTTETMLEDVGKGFEAMGWNVIEVADGNDREALRGAVGSALDCRGRPTLIVGHTKIAHGTLKEGTVDSHGSPLGADVIADFKRNRRLPVEKPFWLPRYVEETLAGALASGAEAQRAWEDRLAAFRSANPGRAREWDLCFSGASRDELLTRTDRALSALDFSSKPKIATRSASAMVMSALAKELPCMFGGSADLANSTKTDAFEKVTGYFRGDLEPGTWRGRGIHYGVREHAMGSISNGVAVHGGLLPFTGTFLVFSDYMRPAIRLAGISRLPVTFIFTHDSVFLGEDGETHQPVEHLWALRAIPRTILLRPADAHECVHAWRCILSRPADAGPAILVLTRQDMPVLEETRGRQADFDRGAYVLRNGDVARPDIQVIATGSEVALALEAARLLEERHGRKARVISMPCVELFGSQPREVQDAVLLPDVPLRLSVEAGTDTGWKRFTGSAGDEYAIRDFGQSAPASDLARLYGFEPEPLCEHMAQMIAGARAPSSRDR